MRTVDIPLRGCGPTEADFRRLALGRCAEFEEFAGLEIEHPGENVGGKLGDFGVEVANNSIVVAAGVLDAVFDRV